MPVSSGNLWCWPIVQSPEPADESLENDHHGIKHVYAVAAEYGPPTYVITISPRAHPSMHAIPWAPTGLLSAAERGLPSALEVLLRHGASRYTANRDWETAVWHTAHCGYQSCIIALCFNSGGLNQKSMEGRHLS